MGIHYNQGADLLDYLENPEVFKKYLMPVLARIVDADRDRRPSAHSVPSGRVEYNFSSNREDSLSRKPSNRW